MCIIYMCIIYIIYCQINCYIGTCVVYFNTLDCVITGTLDEKHKKYNMINM